MSYVRERFLDARLCNGNAGVPDLRAVHQVVLITGKLEVRVEGRSDDQHQP